MITKELNGALWQQTANGPLFRLSLLRHKSKSFFTGEVLARSTVPGRLIHAITTEGEEPPLPTQRPEVSYLEEPGIDAPEDRIGIRTRKWKERHERNPEQGWNFWLKVANYAGALQSSGFHPVELERNDEVWMYYLGLMNERFETHLARIEDVARTAPLPANQQLLEDFRTIRYGFCAFASRARDALCENRLDC